MLIRGVEESSRPRQAHNLETAGANPAPATNYGPAPYGVGLACAPVCQSNNGAIMADAVAMSPGICHKGPPANRDGTDGELRGAVRSPAIEAVAAQDQYRVSPLPGLVAWRGRPTESQRPTRRRSAGLNPAPSHNV